MVVASLAATSCKKAEIADNESHGLALKYMDTTVNPGDDFFRYVNGVWYDSTEIPSDRSRWGSFDELRKSTNQDVLNILKEAAASKNLVASSDEGKAVNLYKTYLDTIKRSQVGITPIQNDLAQISALKNASEIDQLVQKTIFDGGTGLFGIYVGADAKDSNRNVIYIYGAEKGLPDRDYYVLADAESQRIRDEYKKHIAKMFVAVGNTEAEGKYKADRILNFETKIAEAEFTRVQLRDDRLLYNPMSIAQLQKTAPSINWKGYFEKTGLKNVDSVVVMQPKVLTKISNLIKNTPIDDLKAYLAWNVINSSASLLSPELETANWEFYDKTLNGSLNQKPIEEKAVDIVSGNLGEALGKLYVEKKFPAEAKAKAQQMIADIIKAYENRINKLPWMTPATRQGALDKLAKLTIKIGYPDKWEDFSQLTINAPEQGTYYDNIKAISQWQIKKNLADFGKPVDKLRWGMPPQMVNAYYNPTYNEIVFPAAILQPPFYDYKADEAVNFGGIGAVIGHEISHGFDDQGARYDAEGNLVDWWTPEDLSQFTKLGKLLAGQYSALQPFEGVYVDGDFTLGENIGDLGGVTAAYEGLKLYLAQHPQEKIDGFTPEQRFFISWGTIWRTKARDEYIKNQVKTDPHAPGLYRSYVPLQNVDAWYEAFNVQPNNKLYIEPEKRVKIW